MKKKLLCLMMAIMMVAVTISGCKIKNYDAVLIDVNDGEDGITLGYVNFVFKYNQARYDINYGQQYGMTMWTQDMTGSGEIFVDEVKENVIDTIEEQYLIKKHAEEYGVTLSDEDNTKIDEAVNSFMNANTSSALSELGADKDVVRELFEYMTYVSKVEQAVTAIGEASGEINEETNAATYFGNVVDGWKNETEFSVDDSLLAQIKVDGMFNSATATATNSTEESAE